MATIKGGVKICDSCGSDCTRLYGFVMEVRKNMSQDARVMKKVDEIDKEFGQHDFLFCWSCTAKAFGVETEKQKAMAKARDAKGAKDDKQKETKKT